jgi:hypothetical protein
VIGAAILALAISLFSAPLASADTEHGPRLAAGAPLRHTLVSCATNTAQALTCIQSVSVIPKAGDKAIAGKITGKTVLSGFDGRIGDSERPISGAALTPAEIAKLEVKVLISNEECCHDPRTLLSLEKNVSGKWVTLISNLSFYASDPNTLQSTTPNLNASSLLSLKDAQKYFPEISNSWNMQSSKIVYEGSQLRFKVDGGNWQWYSKFPVTLSPENSAPKLKVSQGSYDEWAFVSGSTSSAATSPIVVYSEFQPYLATWCWTAASCSSNREEYTLYLKSSLGTDTWKDNKDISFVVTIRAPKTFAFGEVSGSARNTVVKYGKDLPDFKGIAMREIIATLSPIATARSNQMAGSPPEEKAYGYTYDANLNIFGMHNDITQFLGPCGQMGGVHVVSNAMHSIDPVWDPVSETIKVRLETPHFAPDGGLNNGYLELRIPRESALCMWKLDLDGSINASVSITYDDGSSPSVGTVIGKRIENDYLIITSGFHFSSPNLAVKIVKGTQTSTPQPAATSEPVITPEAVASPEPAISPVAAVAKKMTITCVKGRMSKKVTAVKPVCPAGYKRK